MPDIEAENGDPLTLQETRAIQALTHLAKRWPKTLTLVSMGGGLHVIHTEDERFHDGNYAVRGEAVLVTIPGIPNDGGDW